MEFNNRFQRDSIFGGPVSSNDFSQPNHNDDMAAPKKVENEISGFGKYGYKNETGYKVYYFAENKWGFSGFSGGKFTFDVFDGPPPPGGKFGLYPVGFYTNFSKRKVGASGSGYIGKVGRSTIIQQDDESFPGIEAAPSRGKSGYTRPPKRNQIVIWWSQFKEWLNK